jgi:hypothetical protein
MVRVAVRTLTLQVFKAALHNELTAEFLGRTVPEYFSNLVWVVGNRSIAMDACLRSGNGDGPATPALGQLEGHVAEHLDLFCYMSDVIMLNFKALTHHLSVQLVDSLFIPLYVHCITWDSDQTMTPVVASEASSEPSEVDDNADRSIGIVVALYLTAQMLLIFDHPPVVNTVAAAILLGKAELGDQQPGDVETLSFGLRQMMLEGDRLADVSAAATKKTADALASAAAAGGRPVPASAVVKAEDAAAADVVTDDHPTPRRSTPDKSNHVERPTAECRAEALARLVRLLDPTVNDVVALQTMVMLHAVMSNQGSYGRIVKAAGLIRPAAGVGVGSYDQELVKALLWVIEVTARADHCGRLCTLGLAIQLTLQLTITPPEEEEEDPKLLAHPPSVLTSEHRALVHQVYDFAVAQLLQSYGKYADSGKEARGRFLDTFELEVKRVKPVKISVLMSQASVLLVPSSAERGNMDFEWRLPTEGEETARRIMQTFFYVRKLWLKVSAPP